MLAISVEDQRELLYHYEWIKRGKGTLGGCTGFRGEVHLLMRGLYFAWNCLFPDTEDGIRLTWPVDVWLTHWDSHCKSVEWKQAFSQWFTGSSLRNNPSIPTSSYSGWRQPAQNKTSRWDSFCLMYFRLTAKLLITVAVRHFSPDLSVVDSKLCTEPNRAALLCYTGPAWWDKRPGHKYNTGVPELSTVTGSSRPCWGAEENPLCLLYII